MSHFKERLYKMLAQKMQHFVTLWLSCGWALWKMQSTWACRSCSWGHGCYYLGTSWGNNVPCEQFEGMQTPNFHSLDVFLRRFISIVAVSVDLRFLGTFLSESVLWLAGSSFGPYSWEPRTAAHEPLSKSGVQLVGFTWFRAEGLGFGEPGHPYWGASGWMFFFSIFPSLWSICFLNWAYPKTLLVTCEYCWIFVHWLLLLIPVDGWARGLYGTAAWGF